MKGRRISAPALRGARTKRIAQGVCAAACAAIVALAVLTPPAAAVVFPNLYRLTVTPTPATGTSQAAAIELAMRGLLMRLTGTRDPDADPSLSQLLGDASSYVSYFGMVDSERAQVEFYPTQVDDALESLGYPVWGAERPLTLLWIAIDAGDGERVLLSDSGIGDTAGGVGLRPETVELAEAVRTEIETVADQRGLPIRFPLFDLEDMTSMTSADIWGGFVEQVQRASARYGADAILIGRIRFNPFGNTVHWTLVRQNERSSFAGTEPGEGLHWVADRYVEAYGFVGGARTIRLVVRDVSGLNDYLRVLSYLEGLSALESVDVDGYDDEGGLLTLRASARSDVAVLEQTLGLGRLLQLETTAAARPDNTLVLKWVGGTRR